MKGDNKQCVPNWLYREENYSDALLRTVIQVKISLTVKMSFCILPSRFHTFQQYDPEFHCCRYVLIQQNFKCTRLDRPLRFQEFQTPVISRESAHERSKVVSPTHRPLLPNRRYAWHSFPLQVKPTPKSHCCRNFHVNEKFQWQDLESNTRL